MIHRHSHRTVRARACHALAVSLPLLASAAMLAGCSGDDDDPIDTVDASGSPGSAGEPGETVTLPLLGTRPLPPELTAPTGIAWDIDSGHFVVVTDTGQIATFDGDSFALAGTAGSGVAELNDVSTGTDGPIALAPSGALVSFDVDETGAVTLGETVTPALDFEPRGVAVSPESGRPVISRDGPAGPVLWSIDGTTATEALQLADASLTDTRSLAILGSSYLVGDADAPAFTVFDETGSFEVRLQAGGLASIGGITNRDGTFVLAGTDVDGMAVLAAYDLSNGEEIDPDPAAGPATLNATLRSTERVALPDGLAQPSGIAYDGRTDSLVFSTDQAEFFALSPDLAEIRFGFDIPGFNQGAVEDIVVTGPGRALVVTEDADYVPFDHDGSAWTAGDIVTVDGVDEEVSAIGFDTATGQLVYLPESGPGKSLLVVAPTGELVQEIEIDTAAVGLENLDDYTVAGIAHADGTFYVLSERYSTVFTMTPDGTVTGAYGLEDAAEASGITVFDGSLWVVFDHEDSQPVPPVARFPLP